jgi:ribosomal protein S20
MANNKSAEKRIKTNERNRNKPFYKTSVRTLKNLLKT